MEGTLDATGKSYVPTKAYVFIHLTQVQLNEKESFTAIANNPVGKAADDNGSQDNVIGSGSLNVLPTTMQLGEKFDMMYM